MASKKKWKRRALKELDRADNQERIADDLFAQVGMLSGQLREVDELLLNAEFPGPTIDAWAAQMQQFVNRIVEVRGVRGKSSSVSPSGTTTAPSTSGPNSQSPTSPAITEGEYELLSPQDLKPFSQEQVNLITGSTQVPAGPDRFA